MGLSRYTKHLIFLTEYYPRKYWRVIHRCGHSKVSVWMRWKTVLLTIPNLD